MNTSESTIDLTPTWQAMIPVLIAVIKNGDSNGVAHEELMRLAKFADHTIAKAKSAANKGGLTWLID